MPKTHAAVPELASLLDGSSAGELIPELARHGLQQLIELELAAFLGADWHERTEERLGTTTDTATAASNSSRPINAIAVPPPQFASSAPMSTRQPAGQIQHAGPKAPAAGVNPKKCGSTSHQRSPNRSWRYH